MKPTLLIKNGTIVTSVDIYNSDIFIQDGKITTIGKTLKIKADQTIDGEGCYILPGGIDPHTHMDLPFMGTSSSDGFETGTIGALHGGTTTILDFAIQTPGNSLNHALNEWHEKASGKAVCDYGFHMGVTDFNEGTREEIRTLVEKNGIPSFKTYMAYKGALMIPDRQMVELMSEVEKYGGFVMAHCENGDLIDANISRFKAEGKLTPEYHVLSRPPLAEAEATGRAIDLAHSGHHSLYIVHLTCEEALNRVRQATLRNQKVWTETCIQYLLLDQSRYFEGGQDGFMGAQFVMSPPLREKKDQESLWSGINQNLIHTVATDHCPFLTSQKKMGKGDFSKIPNGIPGVEHRIELLYSEGVAKGRITLNQWVELTSTGAARIFGLLPQKGTIAVGSDADLIIFDPNQNHVISKDTHHFNCDYSAYEGWKVKGKCRTTLLRGTIAVEEGTLKVGKGFGNYLNRKAQSKNV